MFRRNVTVPKNLPKFYAYAMFMNSGPDHDYMRKNNEEKNCTHK